jgi:hypothetical protein
MFYAALDVSLRSIAVCIIDDEGKVRLERSVPSEVPDLVRCLQGSPDCEEKRDPRERSTADQLTELDPHARLEKLTFAGCLKTCFEPCGPSGAALGKNKFAHG